MLFVTFFLHFMELPWIVYCYLPNTKYIYLARIFSSAMIISESTLAQIVNCVSVFESWFVFRWYFIKFRVTTPAYTRLQDWRKIIPFSEAIIYQRWQTQNTRPVFSFLMHLQQVDYWSYILHSPNTWKKMGIQWRSSSALYRLQESLWFS